MIFVAIPVHLYASSERQEMENNENFLLTLRQLSTPARESEVDRAAQGQS